MTWFDKGERLNDCLSVCPPVPAHLHLCWKVCGKPDDSKVPFANNLVQFVASNLALCADTLWNEHD